MPMDGLFRSQIPNDSDGSINPHGVDAKAFGERPEPRSDRGARQRGRPFGGGVSLLHEFPLRPDLFGVRLPLPVFFPHRQLPDDHGSVGRRRSPSPFHRSGGRRQRHSPAEGGLLEGNGIRGIPRSGRQVCRRSLEYRRRQQSRARRAFDLRRRGPGLEPFGCFRHLPP